MLNLPALLEQKLIDANTLREFNHKPSGKLSASCLSWPVQWQILKWLGKPQQKPLNYGAMRRGVMAERHIIELLADEPNIKTQVYVQYRGVVGYLDLLIGDDVVEIKSKGHKGFTALKDAQRAHALQACLYALALEKDEFGVLYIDADTYETKLFTYRTSRWSPLVERIIDNFESAKKTFVSTNMVPGFVGLERTHNLAIWNNYPEYAKYTEPFYLLQ